MEILYLILFGFLSASFTSFFVAMESREWKDISGRSKCSCGAKIKPIYLIPIIGSLLNNFTCPSCKQKYPKTMFISELSAFFVFVGLYTLSGSTLTLTDIISVKSLVLAFSASMFGMIIYEDLDSKLIHDKYTILAFISMLIYFHSHTDIALIMIGIMLSFKILADNYLRLKIKYLNPNTKNKLNIEKTILLVSVIIALVSEILLFVFHINTLIAFYLIGIVFLIKILMENISIYFIDTKEEQEEIEAMGEGDIALFAIIGLLTSNINIIVYSFIIIPIIGMIFKLTLFRKENTIPFGPAIILGSVFTPLIFH